MPLAGVPNPALKGFSGMDVSPTRVPRLDPCDFFTPNLDRTLVRAVAGGVLDWAVAAGVLDWAVAAGVLDWAVAGGVLDWAVAAGVLDWAVAGVLDPVRIRFCLLVAVS